MAIVDGRSIKSSGENGEPGVSVPISASYNRHYVSQLIGADARFEKIRFDGPNDPRIERSSDDDVARGLSDRSGAPGAREGAKASLEGSHLHQQRERRRVQTDVSRICAGYALVVDSPTEFQITPMQIDTWNRDAMNFSGEPFGSDRVRRGSAASLLGHGERVVLRTLGVSDDDAHFEGD